MRALTLTRRGSSASSPGVTRATANSQGWLYTNDLTLVSGHSNALTKSAGRAFQRKATLKPIFAHILVKNPTSAL